jgi:hypothetical protein
MRFWLERGSGTVTTMIAIGSVVALVFGLLAGIAVITRATEALRAAERAAIALATLIAEGEPDPCSRAQPPVIACARDGSAATVSVELRGARATATAGPDR